jgi:hypothetical protein
METGTFFGFRKVVSVDKGADFELVVSVEEEGDKKISLSMKFNKLDTLLLAWKIVENLEDIVPDKDFEPIFEFFEEIEDQFLGRADSEEKNKKELDVGGDNLKAKIDLCKESEIHLRRYQEKLLTELVKSATYSKTMEEKIKEGGQEKGYREDIIVALDGNAWSAHRVHGFTNIQECICGFGDTPVDAVASLLKKEMYEKSKKE